jgi:hypothetical protein
MWRSSVFVLVALASALASPDLAVKTVTHIQNPGAKPDLLSSLQENLYVQRHNWRRESLISLEPGLRDFSFVTPRLVIIERCDERLQYQLNPATREYIRRKTSSPAPNRLSRLLWRIGRKDTLAAGAVTYTSLDSETQTPVRPRKSSAKPLIISLLAPAAGPQLGRDSPRAWTWLMGGSWKV